MNKARKQLAAALFKLALSEELEFILSDSNTNASSLVIQQMAIATTTTIRKKRNFPSLSFCIIRSLRSLIGKAVH